MHKLPRHKQIKVFEGFAGYGGAAFSLYCSEDAMVYTLKVETNRISK